MMAETHAARAWERSKEFWGNPQLDDPELYYTKEDAEKVMGDEIAHFDFSTKTTRVNMKTLEERLGMKNLEPVEKHELGHYQFCPYDLKTCIKLISEADKVLNDVGKAKFAENIFADILLNTHMVNKGDRSIVDVYTKLGSSSEKFWNIYMRTYEMLWNLPPQALSANSKADKDAKKIADIVTQSMYSPEQWPKAMRDVAKILKKYLPPQDCDKSEAAGKAGPLIDSHSPKDFIPYKVKEGDAAAEKQLGKDLSGISKDVSYEQFKRVAAGTELCTEETAATLFHLDVARRFELPPPEKHSYSASEFPTTPVEWLPEDDVEKLDILYSVEQHGHIVPSETTYKWRFEKGMSGSRSSTPLDLLICIDSSGSMPDPSQYLSIPVVSALAAAHSALNQGANVAVIGFSSTFFSLGYTSRRSTIDDTIRRYLNGGTIIPGAEILNAARSNPRRQHILIITDTCISNIESEKGALADARAAAGGGTIFLYGSLSDDTKQLESLGYNVRNATTVEDLLAMTQRLSAELYGG